MGIFNKNSGLNVRLNLTAGPELCRAMAARIITESSKQGESHRPMSISVRQRRAELTSESSWNINYSDHLSWVTRRNGDSAGWIRSWFTLLRYRICA